MADTRKSAALKTPLFEEDNRKEDLPASCFADQGVTVKLCQQDFNVAPSKVND